MDFSCSGESIRKWKNRQRLQRSIATFVNLTVNRRGAGLRNLKVAYLATCRVSVDPLGGLPTGWARLSYQAYSATCQDLELTVQ